MLKQLPKVNCRARREPCALGGDDLSLRVPQWGPMPHLVWTLMVGEAVRGGKVAEGVWELCTFSFAMNLKLL